MKKITYLFLVFLLLTTCQKQKETKIEKSEFTVLFTGGSEADVLIKDEGIESSDIYDYKLSMIEKLREDDKKVLLFNTGNLFNNSKLSSPLNRNDREAYANFILDLFKGLEMTAINASIEDFMIDEDFLSSHKDSVEFAMISSNVFNTVTGKPPLFEFHVRKIAGIRVGIFGLTSAIDNTPASIEVRDPLEIAGLMAKVLGKVADLTIALSNMPLEMNMALADSVSNIDLIIGHHDGEIMLNPKIVNGIPIYMIGLKGGEMGRIDLKLSNMRLALTDVTAKMVEAPNTVSFRIIDLSEDIPSN